MDAVVIDHVAQDGVFAHHRNVLIWSWRASATPLTCQRMRVQLLALAKANPTGAGAITIIGPDVGIPPDEVRKLMVKARQEAAVYDMRGGAIVYEGDGFRGSVVRGVVTSLMLLATNIYPQAVFGDVPSALAWLAKRMGGAAPPGDGLLSAVLAAHAHGRGGASTLRLGSPWRGSIHPGGLALPWRGSIYTRVTWVHSAGALRRRPPPPPG